MDEVAQVDEVLFKIAMSDTDEALSSALKKHLAPTLLKLTSQNEAVRKKVKLTTWFHEFYEYESTNFFYQIFVLIFSNAQNWEKMSFLASKEFVFFRVWKIRENMSWAR